VTGKIKYNHGAIIVTAQVIGHLNVENLQTNVTIVGNIDIMQKIVGTKQRKEEIMKRRRIGKKRRKQRIQMNPRTNK